MAEHLLARPLDALSLADLLLVVALFVGVSTVIDMLGVWWKGRK